MKRFFRQSILIVVLAGLVGGANALWNPATPPWSPEVLGEGEVNLAIVDSWEEPVLWVDARSEEAYAEDRIPGAVLLNEDRFDELLPELLETWTGAERIVVYCDSRQCGASKAVADRLRDDYGFEDVYVLKGGWVEWVDSGVVEWWSGGVVEW